MRWDRVLGVICVRTTPGLLRAPQDIAGSWYGAAALHGGNISLRVDLTRSDSERR